MDKLGYDATDRNEVYLVLEEDGTEVRVRGVLWGPGGSSSPPLVLGKH